MKYTMEQIMEMDDGEQYQAFAKNLSLDELFEYAICASTYVDKLVSDHTKVMKAIDSDRKNIIKRLRNMGEEKARFAADTLENEWFFGEKK